MKAPTKTELWWAMTPTWVKAALLLGAVHVLGGRRL